MAAAAPRRTKIVATIGPVSENHDTLLALAEAGMDAARLNFSHGTHADMARRTELLRQVQDEIGRPLSIIADLQGPKLRIGELPERVVLQRGEGVTLVGGEHCSCSRCRCSRC
jgi:pyruvate kinase